MIDRHPWPVRQVHQTFSARALNQVVFQHPLIVAPDHGDPVFRGSPAVLCAKPPATATEHRSKPAKTTTLPHGIGIGPRCLPRLLGEVPSRPRRRNSIWLRGAVEKPTNANDQPGYSCLQVRPCTYSVHKRFSFAKSRVIPALLPHSLP